MVVDENDYLSHYGILRKSGRYPWGSGKDVATRNRTFLDIVAGYEKQGFKAAEIAEMTGLESSTDLIDLKRVAQNREKQAEIARVWSLTDHGYSNGEIAKIMGKPGESSIRALKAPGVKERAEILTNTADSLRRQVDKAKFLDVGTGVENHMGISKEQLRAAVAILREEGYVVHRPKSPQLGTTHDTRQKVLCVPGTTLGEAMKNKFNVALPEEVTKNGGKTFQKPKEHPIVSIDSRRVKVVPLEEGGDKADGVIFVRPGVEDVSLGKNRYAQVRVMVDGSHFIKGMALYKDDLPRGVDLEFHTAKSRSDDKLENLKPLAVDKATGKIDKAFPFKTVTKQILLDEGGPNERPTAMNKVFEEGDWANWSKSLSSQFLSKQSPTLAKAQLDKTYTTRKNEFDEISSLTNPTVRKFFLEKFSESTDSAASHLEAARLHAEQRWHVILPISTMKETEVFAPNYENGTRVVLVRFPHAGPFEIPELIVNNRHPDAKKYLDNVPDAIGIHHKVAERLSGADFDGDTVIVIPNMQNKVKTAPALEGLKNFNPKTEYPKYDGMKVISPVDKQREMGKISNLITDMTLQGAGPDQLARAVRHSMVIIDSEKHELNYKKSYVDHGIAALKKEYQGGASKGASTLISRAGSPSYRPQTRPARVNEGGPIDPVTGRKNVVPTGKTRLSVDKKTGEVSTVLVGERKRRLAITEDAHTLISDKNTRMEGLYADHSNRLKDLANQARLVTINTPSIKQNNSAKETYAAERASLDAQLHLAQMNAPLERRAQLVGNTNAKLKKDANPFMEKDTYKKVRFRELELARLRVGAKKYQIQISQKEWDAIQAGAISNAKLEEIIRNTDIDNLRKLATPRQRRLMGVGERDRAQMMFATGATRQQVAAVLGVSLTTLDRAMNGEVLE